METVRSALLTTDPATLLNSDITLASENDRRTLVRQLLQLFDNGELADISVLAPTGLYQQGARLKYTAMARDLRRYISDRSKRSVGRRAAILIAQLTSQSELESDLLRVALDNEEDLKVREAAAIAVRTVGSEHAQARLKTLVTIEPKFDPLDELKGIGLAATWPDHLSPDELFTALIDPQRPNFIGEYQHFLASDWQAYLGRADMVRALQWAQRYAPKTQAEYTPIASAAIKVVIAATDSFTDPQVCDLVGQILIGIVRAPVPILGLMNKLALNRLARNAFARASIRRSAGDLYTAECLRRYGVVDDSDIYFLLAQIDARWPLSEQKAIAFLISSLLDGVPWSDSELIERVLSMAKSHPILATALERVIGPVLLHSEQAEQQRAAYAARSPRHKEFPASETAQDPEGRIAEADPERATAFMYFCHALAGTNWDPTTGVLPEWNALSVDTRRKIARSAKTFLIRCCPAGTGWIETGEIWYFVTCGYWALRLLAQTAPDFLHQLSDDVWYAWTPSLWREQPVIPDVVHEGLLRTSHQRTPERFLELLSRFIDAQSQLGDVPALDVLPQIWDSEIAEILLSKLEEGQIQPRVWRQVLSTLLRAGELRAATIASTTLAKANQNPRVEGNLLAVEAARALLNNDPAVGWKVVWPVIGTNCTIAETVLGSYGHDPYSSDTSMLMQRLDESALTDLLIWLLEHDQSEGIEAESGNRRAGPFALISTNERWKWLRIVAFDALMQRGTVAATAAMRKIRIRFPHENLYRAEKVAEELTRQKTWTPLTPSALLRVVSDGVHEESPAPTARRKRGRPAQIDANLKSEALKAQEGGAPWREVAQILYKSKYPSPQQVKNASNILKHYKRSVQQRP